MNIRILLPSLLSICCHTTYAANFKINSSHCQGNSSQISSKIAQAMIRVRQGDPIPLSEIVRHNVSIGKGNEVIKAIKPYAQSTSPEVKDALLDSLELIHGLGSMNLLISLVEDNDVGDSAVNALYVSYSRPYLVKFGGNNLKSALIRVFIKDHYATYATLLLSYFSPDESLIKILSRRLSTYKDKDLFAAEIVCIDLSLLEMEDKNSILRVNKYFTEKKISYLVLTLRYIDFINNVSVLYKITELLGDKEIARSTHFPDGAVQHTRLCDEAMVALSAKFSSSPLSYGDAPHFTDAELLAAYKKYLAILAAKAPTNRVIQPQLAQPSR